MTNEEINRYIHEEILGLCSSCQFAMHSTHEDECVPFGSMPDYCNDLNLAAKAEAVVIERVGFSHYYEALRKLWPTDYMQQIITAAARQRCEAMYSVMEKNAV